MRGRITLSIKKRTYSESRRYTDKWNILDTLTLESSMPGHYTVTSRRTGQQFLISRDELAFVRFLLGSFGSGDYSIMIFGKGKNRGFRRFWDGIISPDGKFLRRKEHGATSEPSFFQRESLFSTYTESFIGKYMKTRRPGIWYNL